MRPLVVLIAFILISPLLFAVNMEPCKDCYYTDLVMFERTTSEGRELAAQLTYYEIGFTRTEIENILAHVRDDPLTSGGEPTPTFDVLNDVPINFYFEDSANPLPDGSFPLVEILGCESVTTGQDEPNGEAVCHILNINDYVEDVSCVTVWAKFDATDQVGPGDFSYVSSEASHTVCNTQIPLLAGLIDFGQCFPLFVILGLLIAAMYSAGLDPLATFDISTPRTPRVKRKPLSGGVFFLTWPFTRQANIAALKSTKKLASRMRKRIEELLKGNVDPKEARTQLRLLGLSEEKCQFLKEIMANPKYKKLDEDDKLLIFIAVMSSTRDVYWEKVNRILNGTMSLEEREEFRPKIEAHFTSFDKTLASKIQKIDSKLTSLKTREEELQKQILKTSDQVQKTDLAEQLRKILASRNAYLLQKKLYGDITEIELTRVRYDTAKANYEATLVASGFGVGFGLNRKTNRFTRLVARVPILSSAVSEISVKGGIIGRGLVGSALIIPAAVKYAQVKAKGGSAEDLRSGLLGKAMKYYDLKIGKLENSFEKGVWEVDKIAAELRRQGMLDDKHAAQIVREGHDRLLERRSKIKGVGGWDKESETKEKWQKRLKGRATGHDGRQGDNEWLDGVVNELEGLKEIHVGRQKVTLLAKGLFERVERGKIDESEMNSLIRRANSSNEVDGLKKIFNDAKTAHGIGDAEAERIVELGQNKQKLVRLFENLRAKFDEDASEKKLKGKSDKEKEKIRRAEFNKKMLIVVEQLGPRRVEEILEMHDKGEVELSDDKLSPEYSREFRRRLDKLVNEYSSKDPVQNRFLKMGDIDVRALADLRLFLERFGKEYGLGGINPMSVDEELKARNAAAAIHMKFFDLAGWAKSRSDEWFKNRYANYHIVKEHLRLIKEKDAETGARINELQTRQKSREERIKELQTKQADKTISKKEEKELEERNKAGKKEQKELKELESKPRLAEEFTKALLAQQTSGGKTDSIIQTHGAQPSLIVEKMENKGELAEHLMGLLHQEKSLLTKDKIKELSGLKDKGELRNKLEELSKQDKGLGALLTKDKIKELSDLKDKGELRNKLEELSKQAQESRDIYNNAKNNELAGLLAEGYYFANREEDEANRFRFKQQYGEPRTERLVFEAKFIDGQLRFFGDQIFEPPGQTYDNGKIYKFLDGNNTGVNLEKSLDDAHRAVVLLEEIDRRKLAPGQDITFLELISGGPWAQTPETTIIPAGISGKPSKWEEEDWDRAVDFHNFVHFSTAEHLMMGQPYVREGDKWVRYDKKIHPRLEVLEANGQIIMGPAEMGVGSPQSLFSNGFMFNAIGTAALTPTGYEMIRMKELNVAMQMYTQNLMNDYFKSLKDARNSYSASYMSMEHDIEELKKNEADKKILKQKIAERKKETEDFKIAYERQDAELKASDPMKYAAMNNLAKALNTWLDWGPVPVRGLRQVSSALGGHDTYMSAHYAQSDTAPMFMPKFGDWRFNEYGFHDGFRYALPGPYGKLIGGMADLAQMVAVPMAVYTKRAGQRLAGMPNPYEPQRQMMPDRRGAFASLIGPMLSFPAFMAPGFLPGVYGYNDPFEVGGIAKSWFGRKTHLYDLSVKSRTLAYEGPSKSSKIGRALNYVWLPKLFQNYSLDGSQTETTLTRGMYPYGRQMFVSYLFNENLSRPPLPGQQYVDPWGGWHLYPSAAISLRDFRPDLLTEDDRQRSIPIDVYARETTPVGMFMKRQAEADRYVDSSSIGAGLTSETTGSILSLVNPSLWISHKALSGWYRNRQDKLKIREVINRTKESSFIKNEEKAKQEKFRYVECSNAGCGRLIPSGSGSCPYCRRSTGA